MTHAQFINQSLGELAIEIMADAPAKYQAGVTLLPFDGTPIHRGLEKAFSYRGQDSHPDAPPVYYEVYRDEFSLVKRMRRKPLGSFWVLLEFDFGVTIAYPSDGPEPGPTRINFDRTYAGWVRAADLNSLAGEEFGSLAVPPASDFVSRWLAPAVVAGCLGALTYLFFSVR